MKRFKSKTKSRIEYFIIIILTFTFIQLYYYNKMVSKNILDISSTKLEEITNVYIKRDIVPTNSNINNLLIINKNKQDEILYVDINAEEANKIMIDVVTKIQNNINKIEFEDDLLKKHNNNIYMKVPLTFNSGSLISSLGPKIPVKLDFYEQVLASIDTEITNYGINNALIKIYLTIDLEQKIYVPFKNDKFKRSYRVLLSAKMTNGNVPSFLGGTLTSHETSTPKH